jgi:hypothetical protein
MSASNSYLKVAFNLSSVKCQKTFQRKVKIRRKIDERSNG